MKRRAFLSTMLAAAVPPNVAEATPDLREIAAAYVRLAEADRQGRQLWGRLGGSETERAAAALLARQLQLPGTRLEPVTVAAHRPVRCTVTVEPGGELQSATPVPFNARFPEAPISAKVARDPVGGAWWLVQGTIKGSVASNSIRDGKCYQRAVEAGAAGLLFSLPGATRFVPPLDKPFADLDENYPDGRRPIPCFCLSEPDAARLALGANVTAEIHFHPRIRWEGQNVVAQLRGRGKQRVAIFAHLDGFFYGAVDNATGLATLVGMARRLKALPAASRLADFSFVGLSAHHDSSAGMRAFRDSDKPRFAALDYLILLEHTDALPPPQNNQRQAFLGKRGWPEVRQALPRLVEESGLMSVPPAIADACIGDLLVTCAEKPGFCLIQAPPSYHTDLDTLDKVSREGLERAVDFHMRLLKVTGGLV